MKTKHMPWVFLILGLQAGVLLTLLVVWHFHPAEKVYFQGEPLRIDSGGEVVWGNAELPAPAPNLPPRLINPPYEHNGTIKPPSPFWSYETSPVNPSEIPQNRLESVPRSLPCLPSGTRRFQVIGDPHGTIWHFDGTIGDVGAWVPEPNPAPLSLGVHSEPIPPAQVYPDDRRPKLRQFLLDGGYHDHVTIKYGPSP